MLVFLVTGVSGAGKSTVAHRLVEWGHRAISLDGDRRLCAWMDQERRRVTRPAAPDATWLATHRWCWDPARLDELIADADRDRIDLLWLCGYADNAFEVVDRFDACFLLDIDQRKMVQRTRAPWRSNDFGRVGDTLDAAMSGHTKFTAAWRRHGAVTVDAMADLDVVVQELLMAAATAALRLRRRSS